MYRSGTVITLLHLKSVSHLPHVLSDSPILAIVQQHVNLTQHLNSAAAENMPLKYWGWISRWYGVSKEKGVKLPFGARFWVFSMCSDANLGVWNAIIHVMALVEVWVLAWQVALDIQQGMSAFDTHASKTGCFTSGDSWQPDHQYWNLPRTWQSPLAYVLHDISRCYCRLFCKSVLLYGIFNNCDAVGLLAGFNSPSTDLAYFTWLHFTCQL